MSGNPDGTEIAVIADDSGLARALELNLEPFGRVRVLDAHHAQLPVHDDPPDLVVVGVSALASEPIAAIAHAALLDCLGRVPLLIISERPFAVSPEFRIAHLGFPFAPEELSAAVVRLLQMSPA